MPELPEVQTIINYLNETISNLKIENIFIKNNKFLKNVNEREFKNLLINQQFKNIFRKGKYLIFKLNEKLYLVIHLRMEGKLFVQNKSFIDKHDYISFELSNKKYLTYNDTRQFGTFHITNNINELKELKKVGIDPLENNFTFNFIKPFINKSNKNIKLFLLDQSIVSGIGNIYASEILFDAKISPLRITRTLDDNEIKKLIISSKEILEKAIKFNGTTIHSFLWNKEETGQFAKFLKVYHRENKECFICKTKIIKVTQQSRSSFYCPKCQH